MQNIDLAQLATAIAVIIGIVNGISLGFPRITSFYKFLIALAVGVLLGFFNYFSLSIELGIVAALASSGLYKLSQNI